MTKNEVRALAALFAQIEPVEDKIGEAYHEIWTGAIAAAAEFVATFSKMGSREFQELCQFDNYRKRHRV